MRFSTMPSSTRTKALILVHGLTVSSRYMVPTALHLAPFYDVYIPDLPGFGKSENPLSALSIPRLADALADWMQAMRLPPSVLLGHSLGCQVVIQLALHYPQLLTHAVLVSPTMDPRTRSISRAALRLARDLSQEPWSFLPVLAHDFLDAGFNRTLRTLYSAFADHMEEHISSVQLPTLIVWGNRDPLVGQEWVEELHRLLPTSQLVAVQGASHVINFNSPEKLACAVRSFLS